MPTIKKEIASPMSTFSDVNPVNDKGDYAESSKLFKEPLEYKKDKVNIRQDIKVEELIKHFTKKYGSELENFLNPKMSVEEITLITKAFTINHNNPSRIPKQLPVDTLREVVFGFENKLDFCDEATVECSDVIHKLVVICSHNDYKVNTPDIFTDDGSTLDHKKLDKLFSEIHNV